MRILFFCNLSALPPKGETRSTTGGSWVAVLTEQLQQHYPDWTLAACGDGFGNWGENVDGLFRYPATAVHSILSRLRKRINPCAEEKQLLPQLLQAIHDFKPDVIHIFGSEFPYGIVAEHSDLPLIIHFQGCLPAYANAKYPPGIEGGHYLRDCGLNIVKLERTWYFDRVFSYRVKRELRILKTCGNYFGRTDWDRAVIEQHHPGARYFYCSEILREPFYDCAGAWKPAKRSTTTIVSLISTPTYKGQDLILKTASFLKGRLNFQWKIIGVAASEMTYWERRTGIAMRDVNVAALGRIADAKKLKNELLCSDIYLHPSYIENSPNSLCEAQILGMPVIATAVGGVPSLVEHNKTGMLIPANDPYMAAWHIKVLAEDTAFAYQLGQQAALVAVARHDRTTILADVLNTYQAISTK